MYRKKGGKKRKASRERSNSHEIQENELSPHQQTSRPQPDKRIIQYRDNNGEAAHIRGNPDMKSPASPKIKLKKSRIEERGRNDLAMYPPSINLSAQHLPQHLEHSDALSGGFFGKAQDVAITGGSFEEIRGHRNNVTIHFNVKGSREEEYEIPPQRQPIQASTSLSSRISDTISHKQEQTANVKVESDQNSIPSVSMSEYSPDNSNVIYERHLKLKRRGFPLWIPGPNMLLPMPYRRKGVDIGDVGIITPSGGFSFLFNICLPPTNQINPPQLPEGFTPIPITPLDLRQYPEFGPGSYLASTHIERIHNDPPSLGLSFKTSAAEGAILTLPEGAIALDLENVPKFQVYAAANIESWYRYANGPRGRQAKNGEIRLVIGCDKATSWGAAAVANLTHHKTHHLKYRPSEDSDGRTTSVSSIPLYQWEYSGMAEARVGPDLREIEALKRNDDSDLAVDGKYWNQTLFLRTLNLTLPDDVFNKINEELESALIQESQQFQNTGGSNNLTSFPPNANPSSSASSRQSNTFSGNQWGSSFELSEADTGNLKGRVTTSITPSAPVIHPADFLNKLLLQKAKAPNIRAVVTQDKDWYSVITDDDDIMPKSAELAERVLAAHHIREADGIIYLEPKNRILMVKSLIRNQRWISKKEDPDIGLPSKLKLTSDLNLPTQNNKGVDSMNKNLQTLTRRLDDMEQRDQQQHQTTQLQLATVTSSLNTMTQTIAGLEDRVVKTQRAILAQSQEIGLTRNVTDTSVNILTLEMNIMLENNPDKKKALQTLLEKMKTQKTNLQATIEKASNDFMAIVTHPIAPLTQATTTSDANTATPITAPMSPMAPPGIPQ